MPDYNKIAEQHLVFEESSTEIDEGAVIRLAVLLRTVVAQEAEWWHKEWHQATGIPCDGMSDYCPIARREKEPSNGRS